MKPMIKPMKNDMFDTWCTLSHLCIACRTYLHCGVLKANFFNTTCLLAATDKNGVSTRTGTDFYAQGNQHSKLLIHCW